MQTRNITYYATPFELDEACNHFIRKTERVLDVGCGIRPQKYFNPQLHVCLEPFQEYIDILNIHYGQNPTFVVLAGMAQDTLKSIPDKSFDSVFLIDVIEHLEKEDGVSLIKELERVSRKQVLLFTPLGFMPQHYEEGDTDAWGLGGTELQKHRSGWEPSDFDDRWEFHACKEYHKPSNPDSGQEIFGAFWAVLNVPANAQTKSLPSKTLFISESLETTDKRSAELRIELKDIDREQYVLASLVGEEAQKAYPARFFEGGKFCRKLKKAALAFETVKRFKDQRKIQKVVLIGGNRLSRCTLKLTAVLLSLKYEERK